MHTLKLHHIPLCDVKHSRNILHLCDVIHASYVNVLLEFYYVSLQGVDGLLQQTGHPASSSKLADSLFPHSMQLSQFGQGF